jgi:major membrane immunogen (membrane-anchored lipoprotein)
VCNKHGAVRSKDRATGKAHGNYKNGNYTQDKLKEQADQNAVLRNLEDVLFVLGAIESNQHTRGRKPTDYKNIKTLDQAQDFIINLEDKT